MSDKELRERVEELEQRVADLEAMVPDGDEDDSAPFEEPGAGVEEPADGWHPGSGEVARKTDECIEMVLMQTGGRFTFNQLDFVVEKVADVSTPDTKKKYRRLVIEHGPFETVSVASTYEVSE